MLSERGTRTLVAIERRLVSVDPSLAHLFDRRLAPSRRPRARNWSILALVGVAVLLMPGFAVLRLPIAFLSCAALLPCALTAYLYWAGTLRSHRRAR